MILDRWLAAERAAWKPQQRLSPSAWAERHRVLSRMQSARPGKWKNAQAPYLAGLMDLCTRRGVEEISIVKAAQMGVSEALRNIVGYFAHQEPDPILLVLPDEQTGRKIVAQRIVPLLRTTPCLAELFTSASRDIQLRHVSLANGFTLRLGWSGSPASLASDPCRVVINDEVDKFQPWSGRESDPISLGYARTQTYEGRRLIVNVSTPTTADGLITRRFEASSSKLRFHVPCPHCGEYQVLAFSNIRWKKFNQHDPAQEAALIEAEKAAWCECCHCHQAIDELGRVAMVRNGRWRVDGIDGPITPETELRGRIGVHLWAAYCLWIPLYRIAAEFIRCKDDPIALMGFTNSWLGEPFRQQIVHSKVEVFASKCDEGAPAQIVPNWAVAVLATVDTQKDHFYYVIRAWGYGYRSQRVDHGLATSFDDLRQRILHARYPCADQRPPMAMCAVAIDSGGTTSLSGSRTHEVYRFALTNPSRIHAMKGASQVMDAPIRTKRVTYRPPDANTAPYPVFLTIFDPNHYKDRLASAIQARVPAIDPHTGEVDGDIEQWSLNEQQDSDYNRQMASEHKVLIRKAGNRQTQAWVPISSSAANHYWDCEVMQFALADMVRVDLLPKPHPPVPVAPPPPREPSIFDQRRPMPIRAPRPIRTRY
ncbi:MAG: terminase gpA endonuclease subunit [Phycisphaerae bacterium]